MLSSEYLCNQKPQTTLNMAMLGVGVRLQLTHVPTSQTVGPRPHPPGSPGVSVDVEGRDGSSKERRGFKEPHFDVGTGVPLRLSVHHTVVAQARQYTHPLLENTRGENQHIEQS